MLNRVNRVKCKNVKQIHGKWELCLIFYYFEVFHKKFSTKKKTELFSRPYKRASLNITVRVDLHEATMGIK